MSPIQKLQAQESEVIRYLETGVRLSPTVQQAARGRLANIGAAIQHLRGEPVELSFGAMIQLDWAHGKATQ